ncbi:hypothetical protein NQ317_016447, partial [Molorchus minor]
MDDLEQEKESSAGGENCEDSTKTNHQDVFKKIVNNTECPFIIKNLWFQQDINQLFSASSYNGRPRSLGYYGSNTTPFSSSYSNSSNPYSSSNSTSNAYGLNYQSPYFSNGYRTPSSTSGYASLKIPAKSLSSVANNNYSKSYGNEREHRSRRDLSRANSYYGRDRSLSRSRNSLASSGLGSRSISLSSLNSEGYVSGTERSSRSRIGSTSDIRNENGEIDYKSCMNNSLLKDKLRKSEEELRETKQTLERINCVTSKNSLSELEKKERRAMERKLSEMEEELKQLQKLKAENERLKADNRSLTRNLENFKTENQRLKDENGALIRILIKNIIKLSILLQLSIIVLFIDNINNL